MELKTYLSGQCNFVNKELLKFLPKGNNEIEKAMRYVINAGGKRLRPILVLEAAKICRGKEKNVIAAACALEYIHTYSLVHDDLPAMDNDDLRRGKPTCHKKFGEAMAILTGDSLLTEAFKILFMSKAEPENKIKAAVILADKAGFSGMIGGQAKDTTETVNWQRKPINQAKANLEYIHEKKTADLIEGSLLIGAVLAGAKDKEIKALSNYGKNIGIAFQIADDILDITADKKLLGKRGSDRDNNKLTYTAVYGIEKSRIKAEQLIKKAKQSILIFGKKAEMLNKLADYIIERSY